MTRWQGPGALSRHLIAVTEVTPHPENPRRGDLDLIEESLRAYGQQRPILYDAERRYIIAGNHTYRAAVERLGWAKIAAVPFQGTSEQADRFLLMDNASSDSAYYDEVLLARVLQAHGDLAGTGYKVGDLDAILARLAKAADDAPKPEPKAKDTAGDPPMREFILLLTPEQHRQFTRWVKMLQREYELDGPIATVVRAVKQEAERL